MPAVARIGDANAAHCSGMVQAAGSGNVFANGIAVSRVGDSNTGHLLPGSPCPGHATPIGSGSGTVFVNGISCGRVGDPTCTSVAAGSGNVFAGGLIDDAIEAMFLLPPSGPNQSLPGVLSLIKDNPEDTETISILIGRYETQT